MKPHFPVGMEWQAASSEPGGARNGGVWAGGAMGRPVDGADAGLAVAGSERALGHGRLGVPCNLPTELSTFVGRADDLERGMGLLSESRLVTFTGAGGCGKTRLARQVAARVAERFPGGVWWVELASLADGALVTERVARTLGLQAGEHGSRRRLFR